MSIEKDKQSLLLDVEMDQLTCNLKRFNRAKLTKIILLVMGVIFVIIMFTGSMHLTAFDFSRPPKRAFATFLSGRQENDMENDNYFTGTRVMAYQLLHQPGVKSKYPFLVFVTKYVTKAKRDVLRNEGAIVIDAPDVKNNGHFITDRWKDIYSKLRIFEQTQYELIAFLDNDMLITKNMDSIFDEPEVVEQYTNVDKLVEKKEVYPDSYLIVGAIDTFKVDHAMPPNEGTYFNGGFFLVKPDKKLYNYYEYLISTDRCDSKYAEQDLLNCAHDTNGPMPAKIFAPGVWSANWPSMKDYKYGTAAIHEKFWNVEPRFAGMSHIWRHLQGATDAFWAKDRKKDKAVGFWNAYLKEGKPQYENWFK